MGERLPIPTNARSRIPEVRQGEHDHSHDGPQQEKKWRCEVHGGPQQERQGHHGQAEVLESIYRYRGSQFIRPEKESRRSDHEEEADRGREPDSTDHVEEPESEQSRVEEDIATRRAKLLRLFENLCDHAGELNVCIKCGRESHEGTCKDTARATESDLARGKIQMLFLPEGHPSSDEDIDMEVPDDDEEMAGNGGADLLSEGRIQRVQLRSESPRDG